MIIHKNRCCEELTHRTNPLTKRRYQSASEASIDFGGPDILVMDVPDHVYLDWTYDPSQRGDARFQPPACPEGWRYDDSMMTVYNPVDRREEERCGLYARWDALEGKLAARIVCGVDVEESRRKLDIIVAYKWAVGQTQYQVGYPDVVEYPELPDL